jgi:hypothetical protein
VTAIVKDNRLKKWLIAILTKIAKKSDFHFSLLKFKQRPLKQQRLKYKEEKKKKRKLKEENGYVKTK